MKNDLIIFDRRRAGIDVVKIATAVSVVIAVVKILQSRTVCVYGSGFKVCNK